jgi:hypothetical protein
MSISFYLWRMNICKTLAGRLLPAFILIFSCPSFAQVTDTIPALPADTLLPADTMSLVRERFIEWDKLLYRFFGDGNFSRGNVNRTLLVARAEITYGGSIVSLTTNPRFTYGQQNFVLAERDTYVDLFIDILKQRRFYGFGLGTIEISNLRAINLRQLAGAGAGFRLTETDNHSLIFTNAVIYESTDFRERETVTTLRNSTRLRGKHIFFQNRMRISHTTFFQPSLYDINNLRWSTLISVELPINKWFVLRTSFENLYESVVALNRQRNDTRITIGFSVGNRN